MNRTVLAVTVKKWFVKQDCGVFVNKPALTSVLVVVLVL